MKKIISALLISVLLLQMSVFAFSCKTDIYVNDNFDGYTATDGVTIPPEKGWSGAANDGAINSSPSDVNMGRCIRLSMSGGNGPFLNRLFRSKEQEFCVEWYAMFAGEPSRKVFELRDNTGTLFSFLETSSDSYSIMNEDKELCGYTALQFCRITLAIDMNNRRYDIYINGEKAGENALPEQFGKTVAGIKISLAAADVNTAMYIDNFRVYKGLTPVCPALFTDAVIDEPKKDDAATAKVKKVVTMVMRGTQALVYGEPVEVEAPPYLKDKTPMIPLRFASETFGGKVEYRADTQEIQVTTAKGSVLRFAEGESTAYCDDKPYPLCVAVEEKKDFAYVPAEDFCKMIGKQFFYDDHGLLYISEEAEPFRLPDEQEVVLEIFKKTAYVRPDSNRILQDFITHNPEPQHPRIFADKAGFAAIKRKMYKHEEVMSWYRNLRHNTEAIFDLDLIAYALPDGRRMNSARTALDRLTKLGMMYQLTGNERYAERAWKEMEAGAAYPDWNPDREYLNTAEMGCAMAIGYDWIYDYMTPAQREVVRESIVKFCLNTAKSAYENDKWWTYSIGNWNAVCAGGVTVAALGVFEDEPFLASEVIQYALRSVEYNLSNYYPDGSYEEGLGYWRYATDYLVNMMASLEGVLGTDYGMFCSNSLDTTGFLPLAFTGPVGTFNFHDGTGGNDAAHMSWFAKKIDSPGLMGQRRNMMVQQKFSPGYKDLLWYDPDWADPAGVDVALDTYYERIQTCFVHENWDSTALFTGLHGGWNNVSHAHYDSGTFNIDANGEHWIIDLGQDTLAYNLPAGMLKSDVYGVRTEGHNCVVINPGMDAGQPEDSYAAITKIESKPKGMYAVIDLKDAYRDHVSSYQRGLMMTDNRKFIMVQDEIVNKQPSTVYWSAHTKANIEVAEDGKSAILTQNNKKFWVGILAGEGKLAAKDAVPLPTSPNPPGQTANKNARKLEITLENVGKVSLTVGFMPLENSQTAPPRLPEVKPIADWTIPDGELVYPTIDEIKVDGQSLEGFTPEMREYQMTIPADAKELPQITANSERADLEVIYEDGPVKSARILATSREDDTLSVSYKVQFTKEVVILDLDPKKKLPVAKVTASEEPQAENSAANAIDGNMGTRWSASGEQWLQLDLGRSYPISVVNMAIYLGSERFQYFDINVSEDGENWTQVFSGASSGSTEEKEAYTFDTVNARYVRINCHGASSTAWNSIVEAEVYQ